MSDDSGERLASRIEALETKLSYLELEIGDLGKIVRESGLGLARMESGMRFIGQRLKELGADADSSLKPPERPPHY